MSAINPAVATVLIAPAPGYASASWLSTVINLASSNATVTVNPTGLAAGNYCTVVRVGAYSAGSSLLSYVDVVVRFRVIGTDPLVISSGFKGCFDLKTGLQLQYGGQDSTGPVITLKENFEGQLSMGELMSPPTTSYWRQTTTGVVFPGAVWPSFNQKNTYAPLVELPFSATPGQSFSASVTQYSTNLSTGVTTTFATYPTTYTFEGYDTLTLAGRTFTNVCRIATTGHVYTSYWTTNTAAGHKFVRWYAPGYGVIKAEMQDATTSATVAGLGAHTRFLQNIVTDVP